MYRFLHGILHFFQFFHAQFIMDIRFDAIYQLAASAHQMAQCTRHLGQAFRANHDQSDDGDDHNFKETDVKHDGAYSLIIR